MSDIEDKQDTPEKPSSLQVIASVAAAAFGVQNSKNRKRDFEQSSILPYIIGGIVFTVLFVGGVYLVVSTVLRSSGAQ
ncbi:MAG: DUF2970 domain-containing protein [Pseudomonadales bacterium]